MIFGYIDAGANQGESACRFYRQTENSVWDYFLFEANPYLIKYLTKNIEEIPNTTIINKAIWTEDTTLDLYIDKSTKGSTVCDKKCKTQHITSVEAIDFDKFILETFDKDDHLVLSMDIEGAEYYVLPKMIESGSLSYFNEYEIEFHLNRMFSKNLEDIHNRIADYFTATRADRKDLYNLYLE